MESNRIVRFLILIFAVLSVIFYLLYDNAKKNQSVLSDDFVKEAVFNLSFHGVDVSGENIERQIPDKNIYRFEYSNMTEYYDLVMSAFENCIEGSSVTTKHETPDGLSVTYSRENAKDEKIGRLVFSQNDFEFSFIVDGNRVFSDNSPVVNGSKSIDDNKKNVVENMLTCITVGNDSGYRIVGSAESDEYTVVSVVQTVSGVDIKDVYINFCFDSDELVYVHGSWIAAKPKALYHEKLVDGVNILYQLKFDSITEVVSERILYSFRKNDENEYFLVPCWEIVTIDENGNTVKTYFDALK